MADISKIKLPDNSEYNIKDKTSGYITSPSVPYLTCSTGASTVAKTTTLVSGTFTADNLVEGAQVVVKFTNSNTATNPTLSVNGTTAKAIKRYGTTAAINTNGGSWYAGAVVAFTYDGTNWLYTWNNTTYSSRAEASGGTNTSLCTDGEKYIWNHKQDALVSGTNIKSVNNQSLLGSGNISISGSGGITASDFEIEEYSFSVSSISSGSGSGVKTIPSETTYFTKSGYKPLGVVGFQSGENDALFTRFKMIDASSGQCRVSYYIRAVAAVSSTTGYVYILWVKE